MSTVTATQLPRLRPGVIIRHVGADEYVVKNPQTHAYFKVGEVEQFLLEQLRGPITSDELCAAFAARFNDELTGDDVQEFIELADRRGVLNTATKPVTQNESATDDDGDADYNDIDPLAHGLAKVKKQSLLYWRYSVLDPDRIFNSLEPKLRWVWTPEFVVFSMLAILFAGFLSWTNRSELVSQFSTHLTWETFVLSWITLITVTTLHEFAHGLTCKHHGGDVHELGVLFVFFMPCFYCNVSDAWLLPQKSKRLWITAAGGYCDLCVWALATFVWRLTPTDTAINYFAWIVMNICGTRGLINFNPLLRLDGYYLLTDLLGVANLRQRAQQHWMATIRWVLWGGERPERDDRAGTLLGYGAFMWVFSTLFICLSLAGLVQSWGQSVGIVGVVLVLALYLYIFTRVWRGFFRGEVTRMLTTRPIRAVVWLLLLGVGAFAATMTLMNDQTTGNFSVRPAKRIEVRAPVAGFLRQVNFDEGDRVAAEAVIGRLEISDLESQIAQKQAEVAETQANLRRLEAGPRQEEIREQRLKVERAVAWRKMAEVDLQRARQTLHEELNRVDQQIAQYRVEAEYLYNSLVQAKKLYDQGGLAGQQFMAERKRYEVSLMQYQQALAQKRAREIAGVGDAEAELARRTKDLADVEASLTLLAAGTRPEQIEAERAHMARLNEELRFLTSQRLKLDVRSPIAGHLTSTRMREKIGQYFEKGALICEIEDHTGLEAEMAVSEQDVAGLKTGLPVELKARSLPFEVFHAKVDRIAPRANKADASSQGTVTLYCRLAEQDANLLSGMTGVGRVTRGESSPWDIASRKALKYLRTEFWW